MHVTSLEIVLAVVAVFVVFGPRELPKRKEKKPAPIKVKQVERVAMYERGPAQFGAGRAPSPLQLRAAERQLRDPDDVSALDKPRFTDGERDASPLPHEMLRV